MSGNTQRLILRSTIFKQKNIVALSWNVYIYIYLEIYSWYIDQEFFLSSVNSTTEMLYNFCLISR